MEVELQTGVDNGESISLIVEPLGPPHAQPCVLVIARDISDLRRAVITRHHGEIVVVSEPSEGTRFEVRLPICDKNDRFVKRTESPTETNSETVPS